MNRLSAKNFINVRLFELLILLSFFLPLLASAAVTHWQILPNESTLTFTGTQNNSPISGKFKNFSGEIQFDPAKLQESHVKIIIDINSVSLSFKDIEGTLKSSDWFDVKLFPQAIFEAHDFVKLNEDHYQAKGSLTIKDKTFPVAVEFTKESDGNNKVKVQGKATIERTKFGIGKGEWGSTDEVQDEVKVNFALTALKKG